MMDRARYIMIGGFLGAGKTTSILALARHLGQRGLTVGLITNDQGNGLVDSAISKAKTLPVEEIGGGCFCCRFNSLVEAAARLTAETRPDVLLAEPVGSCTDLVATVGLPLREIYGEFYDVAPFSVVVDPVRALRILGLEEGKRFSRNVRYIYMKQLEEAEMIIINKIDLLVADRLDSLRQGLAEQFPGRPVLEVSAREERGLDDWFSAVLTGKPTPTDGIIDLDYARYGKGEALLGWLNATLHLESVENDHEFDGNDLLRQLAGGLRNAMGKAGSGVAHLKMTLTPRQDPFELGAINLVRDDAEPELSHRLVDPLEDGELLVNVRAEAAPEALEKALQTAISEVLENGFGLTVDIAHLEHFRPGIPQPTHRFGSSQNA